MWVQDVRMPPQPDVAAVAATGREMSATLSTRTPVADLHRRRAARRRRDAELLTDLDVDLIHAATGENAWSAAATDSLSPFAAQIVADRRSGALAAGVEVTSRYLLATGAAVEAGGGVNPFSGVALELALAHLAARARGGVDLVC